MTTRIPRIAAAIISLALLTTGCGGGADDEADEPTTTAGSGEPEPNPDLIASEIGVTPTEIHIAVLADVGSPIVPGLMKGSQRGVEAFARYINANGGVAGRRLVVDLVDTKLSPDASQSGVLQACESDFALVGTSALFLNNMEPVVQCNDMAGLGTGLPDLAAITASFAHQCSATTYPITGSTLYCDTKDQHPQTYAAPVAGQRWLMEEQDVSKAAWILGGDIDATRQASMPIVRGEEKIGFEGETFVVSGMAPQASYTPVVQRMKADGVDYLENFGADSQLALALKEMALQGVKPKVVACTAACYGRSFLERAAGFAEGVYVWLPYLPHEDADEVPAVKTMVDNVGDDLDGFATMAWMSTMLFAAAVEDVVEANGENGLTRANFMAALQAMTDFDADGMLGGTLDLVNKKNPECAVLMQVKGDGFERVHPTEAGEMDCTDPVVEVEFDNK